jgi:hypothetical protein
MVILQGSEVTKVAVPPEKVFSAADSSISEDEPYVVERKAVPESQIPGRPSSTGPDGVTAPGLHASDKMVGVESELWFGMQCFKLWRTAYAITSPHLVPKDPFKAVL